MTTITIQTSKVYDVTIGSDLLSSFFVTPPAKDSQAVIVTDDIVASYYEAPLKERLQSLGFLCHTFVFSHGEAQKNMATVTELLQFMSEHHVCRTDLIFALGGGIVGDLAGFAASIYLRGIRFIQLPTTLLAAVDSSVGGKTAVNLPAGKNLAGTFTQPMQVFCDTNTLSTLPEEIFSDGCAEVIKYGMISEKGIFPLLKEGLRSHLEEIISLCISIKGEVVAEDEFDTGLRQLLNFGHTLGHAIEKCSDFNISHGSAVAIGMVLMTKAAVKKGFCDSVCLEELLSQIKAYHLPDSCPYTAQQLYDAALSDKKHAAGTITLIVPVSVGKCILYKADNLELYSMIEAALS